MNKMSACQVRSPLARVLALALINALVAQQILGSAAFPSLFNRARLFQLGQPQAGDHQPASQPRPAGQRDQLVLAADSLVPVGLLAQRAAPPHADLLRVGVPARLHQPSPQQMHQQHLEYLKRAAALNEFAAAAAVSAGGPPSPNFGEPGRAQQMGASQSEIVDKIERHIGQQIDQSLGGGGDEQRAVAASGYHAAASHEQEEPAEKGAEEIEQEEPVLEKQPAKKEEEHEQQHEHQEHQEHKEHEQPPEAFEVHHKKGGKSFQYFHQGHSS